MHIPDGFLSTGTWVSTWLISIGGIGYCLKKTTQILKDRMIPLMGVMSAFIFAGQMLNFPVIGGTSGHLLGGVLASVLLGPYAAAVVLTCVLTVQCLIFQDGGLTALGANILNMSLIATIGGYFIYKAIAKIGGKKKGIIPAVFVAAWFSVVLSA
ncbi:MAG: energy-coupling factor ABC transporter permease, partial [Candidatus Omnitrophica bacterium]|nr:energy-coupling factor ABC transporter permease [Candidatus Omnitrophota bacterium]